MEPTDSPPATSAPCRTQPTRPRPSRSGAAWLYDDLLAWLSPGGLLLTALVLEFPAGLHRLRAEAPELVFPTWLAGAYALGLALSPLGRIVYALAQAVVWRHLRVAWAPAVAFMAARLKRDEGIELPPAERMTVDVFHDLDRRMREYLEALDPAAASTLNRMKVLCSLACNTAAACAVFVGIAIVTGHASDWTALGLGIGLPLGALALLAAVYRERRRQRTELSLWRRLQVTR